MGKTPSTLELWHPAPSFLGGQLKEGSDLEGTGQPPFRETVLDEKGRKKGVIYGIQMALFCIHLTDLQHPLFLCGGHRVPDALIDFLQRPLLWKFSIFNFFCIIRNAISLLG